jgi:general secretion pathway protein D
VIGRLFSNRLDDKTKTEIVLLITPRIVRNIVRPGAEIAEFSSGTEASLGSGGAVPGVPVRVVAPPPVTPGRPLPAPPAGPAPPAPSAPATGIPGLPGGPPLVFPPSQPSVAPQSTTPFMPSAPAQ